VTNADYSGSRSAVFGQIVFVSEASQSSAVHLLWVISYPATTYIFRSLFSTINLKAVQPKLLNILLNSAMTDDRLQAMNSRVLGIPLFKEVRNFPIFVH